MSVRNIHKFKRIETRAPRSNLDTTKGIIEYVGIPTVHEFLEWATSKKERGSASIGPSKAISVEFSETGLDKPMESNPTFKAFLDRQVYSVEWDGGYGLFDYFIKIRE